jgi:hypothetical protein
LPPKGAWGSKFAFQGSGVRRCAKVNIFNLAKNADTSVEQIERFYAKHLPLSREMAKNLQSFGEE